MFVEGRGDVAAVPTLVKRLLTGCSGFEVLSIHPEPFVVKGVGNLVKDECANWRRWLAAAMKDRRPLGGVLLVLDGDLKKVPRSWKRYFDRFGEEFCVFKVAAMLAEEARSVRAGEAFSVAVVFAMKEFESWIIAGIEGLRGIKLGGDRGRVAVDATYPPGDMESKRDAKSVLRQLLPDYSESLDQGTLADSLDLEQALTRSRSFRRLSSAVIQVTSAIRAEKHVATPQIA
jgi:hypothetical protein